ncbi:MAG: hypothetical protein V3V06_03600 [Dehalococcoidia bacterium]
MRCTRFAVPALLAATALLLVACGGGGGESAAGDPTPLPAQAPPQARAQDDDRSAAGLPTVLPLNRVVPARVDGLQALSATARSAAVVLSNLVQADGTFWRPADLITETGFQDFFEAVYTASSRAGPAVVVLEIIRLADEAGAQRLLDVLRGQPDRSGTDVALPAGLDAPRSFADRDVATVADGPPLLAGQRLQVASVTTRDGNVLVRTLVFSDSANALETAADLARSQLARLAAARAGDLLPPLDLPFPPIALDAVIARLPAEVQGYARFTSDQDLAGSTQYVGPGGAFMLILLQPLQSAVNAGLLDHRLRQPDVIAGLFADAGSPIRVLDTALLPQPPPAVAVAERWRVDLGGTLLFDDLLAFRRGSVWGVLQGLSPDPGGTPLAGLLRVVTAAIDEVRAGAE